MAHSIARGCSRSLIVPMLIIGVLLCMRAFLLVEGSCVESERRALLAIKADMYNPHNRLSSWRGPDCCGWERISCDSITGHVVELDLGRLSFMYPDFVPPSKVNPSLLNLTHLKHLDLEGNYFAGAPIPRFVSSLTHLEYLDLSDCGFNGSIPHELGNLSSLHSLYLGYNPGLYVDDLEWLSGIHSLKHLGLGGEAPRGGVNLSTASNWLREINMHPSLRELALPCAQLPAIPTNPQFANLTSLTLLDLSGYSFFTTSLSHWLSNFTNLETLYLSGNGLHAEDLGWLGSLHQLKKLDLGDNQITDDFSQQLRNLSHLESLLLGNNNMTSHFLDTLGNLSLHRLDTLDLSLNGISGNLPESIAENLHNLVVLRLRGSNLTGQIPETVGKLYNLNFLDLSNNSLRGMLPRAMGGLCKLRQLFLADNNIGGEITGFVDGLSQCTENKSNGRSSEGGLASLILDNNNFTGLIPESIGQLSKLEVLSLSSNSLEGNVTEDYFTYLTGLYFLDLSYNLVQVNVSQSWIPPFNASYIKLCSCRLGPKFPIWLRTQTNLQSLCLAEAEISGSLPTWIGDLNYLYDLNVSHNQMKGKLPASLENDQAYVYFDVSFNSFDGPIPSLNFSYSQLIDFSNNLFSWSIPSTFAAAMRLKVLSLSNNHLHGGIPMFFCNLSSLKVLDLSENNLSGAPPNCWHNPASIVASPYQLESLHLRKNRLFGNFPPFLRHCRELAVLDLGENKFSGNIPNWIGESFPQLKVLRLRSNSFKGNVPAQISGLISLQVLDLACNNLSGNLPSTFSKFSAMVAIQMNDSKSMLPYDFITSHYKENLLVITKGIELEYTNILILLTSIDLSQNNLSGEIPADLMGLHGLHFLNMSGNHFTGKIPENIGALGQLESLDLSINNLSGTIPPSMSTLNYLSHLDLSNNNLSGRIPSGGQFSTFDPSIYRNNYNLCGWPLKDCPSSGIPSASKSEDEEGNEDLTEMIWTYACAALGFILGFWGFLCATMIRRATRVAYFQFIDRTYDWIYVQLVISYGRVKKSAIM